MSMKEGISSQDPFGFGLRDQIVETVWRLGALLNDQETTKPTKGNSMTDEDSLITKLYALVACWAPQERLKDASGALCEVLDAVDHTSSKVQYALADYSGAIQQSYEGTPRVQLAMCQDYLDTWPNCCFHLVKKVTDTITTDWIAA